MSKGKNYRLMPFWMAISVVVGILIGSFYANHFSGNRLNIINSSGNKLNNLLHIIDDQYVDTVNINDLVEKAMPVRSPASASSSPSVRIPSVCRM